MKTQYLEMVKPQLTGVSSVVEDLAGVDQHRVGVKKLMALEIRLTLKQQKMSPPYLSAPPAC